MCGRELFKFVFLPDPEPMFFVHDHQAQAVKTKITGEQGGGSNDDVGKMTLSRRNLIVIMDMNMKII